MSQDWFTIVNEKQYGPMSTEELRFSLQQKRVSPRDMAWKEGMSEWRLISLIPELKEVLVAVPPNPANLPPLPGSADADPNLCNKKVLAGLMGIFLGEFGVHKFVLGYTKEGTIMLVIGLVGIIFFFIPTLVMGIIGLIEGIMYLCANDKDFVERHKNRSHPWF